MPLFLLALLLARGLPALLYRSLVDTRETVAAALLQATSLGFLVVAAEIWMQRGLVSEASGAALVAAGALSVLLFPLGALTVLWRRGDPDAVPAPAVE